MEAASKSYMDGYNADQAVQYQTAKDLYTKAAETFLECASVKSGSERAQAEFDEAVSLEMEAQVLGKLNDKDASTDASKDARALFEKLAADPAADVPNHFYKERTFTIKVDANSAAKALAMGFELHRQMGQ